MRLIDADKIPYIVAITDTFEPSGEFYARREDICAMPTIKPQLRWIPCSKRLPKIGKDVLVCYDFKGYRSVSIEWYCGDGKFHGYDDEYLTPKGRKCRKAIAWMPLPEPYAERREE